MILYILLCGYPPFTARSPHEIYRKIIKGSYSFSCINIPFTNLLLASEWTSVSKSAKDFIKKLLQKHPSNRISAVDALNDPWIKKYTEKTNVRKPICLNALNQLKNFYCERKLEQAVIAYISNSMLNK